MITITYVVSNGILLICIKQKFWIFKGAGVYHCYKKVRKQAAVVSYSEMT